MATFMVKKTEDLSALRANVQTYEVELKHTSKEFKEFMADKKKSLKERPPTVRDIAELASLMARHMHFMEKYEAALRNLVVALEKRIKELEKKVPKFDVGLER